MNLKVIVIYQFDDDKFICGFVSASFHSQVPPSSDEKKINFCDRNYPWVDSLMQTMTLDQKIGQLFMVAAYSNKDATHQKEIETLIKKYQIGGSNHLSYGPDQAVTLPCLPRRPAQPILGCPGKGVTHGKTRARRPMQRKWGRAREDLRPAAEP